MIGLFFSQVLLFVIAALVGFAAGWRLFLLAHARRREADERELERLRGSLSEAQVRRARV